MIASGVRSSCDTSAMKARRMFSLLCSVPASLLNTRASCPSSSCEDTGTRMSYCPAASARVAVASRLAGTSITRPSSQATTAASSTASPAMYQAALS